MAIVKCPECGMQVSNKASKCPYCGYPFPDYSMDDIFLLLYWIIRFLGWIIVCGVIPFYCSLTWIGYGSILVAIEYIHVFSIDSGFFAAVLIVFTPYWFILISRKIKKEITHKEVLGFCWKWFLKGPFAYLDLKSSNDR